MTSKFTWKKHILSKKGVRHIIFIAFGATFQKQKNKHSAFTKTSTGTNKRLQNNLDKSAFDKGKKHHRKEVRKTHEKWNKIESIDTRVFGKANKTRDKIKQTTSAAYTRLEKEEKTIKLNLWCRTSQSPKRKYKTFTSVLVSLV